MKERKICPDCRAALSPELEAWARKFADCLSDTDKDLDWTDMIFAALIGTLRPDGLGEDLEKLRNAVNECRARKGHNLIEPGNLGETMAHPDAGDCHDGPCPQLG